MNFRKFDKPVFTTMTDIDGNVYKTVRIGDQVWMAQNLKTMRYNDGTPIPHVTSSNWHCYTAAYCWYENSPTCRDHYGCLYNAYAVDTGKLAPKGWHVPTREEWVRLRTYLGPDTSGGKLKEAGIEHWLAPNTGATNSSGFTALPGGYRSPDGSFGSLGRYGYFWLSINATDTLTSWYSYVYKDSMVDGSASGDRGNGLSVRCIKD